MVNMLINKCSFRAAQEMTGIDRGTYRKIWLKLVEKMVILLERRIFNGEYIFDSNMEVEIDEACMVWEAGEVDLLCNDEPIKEESRWILGLINREGSRLSLHCIKDRSDNEILGR